MVNYDFYGVKKKKKCRGSSSFFSNFFSRFLITVLLTIVCLIGFKKSDSFKQSFYDSCFSDNFNFAYFNDLYKKYLGGVLPFSSIFESPKPVFNETLSYNGLEPYMDGVSLNVDFNYMVPFLDSGLVVFVGVKENYGNTVIVKQVNGIDVWYSNLDSINVNMYDYVSGGDYVGNCSNNLYLIFKKDGNVLDYQEYV